MCAAVWVSVRSCVRSVYAAVTTDTIGSGNHVLCLCGGWEDKVATRFSFGRKPVQVHSTIVRKRARCHQHLNVSASRSACHRCRLQRKKIAYTCRVNLQRMCGDSGDICCHRIPHCSARSSAQCHVRSFPTPAPIFCFAKKNYY